MKITTTYLSSSGGNVSSAYKVFNPTTKWKTQWGKSFVDDKAYKLTALMLPQSVYTEYRTKKVLGLKVIVLDIYVTEYDQVLKKEPQREICFETEGIIDCEVIDDFKNRKGIIKLIF